MYNFNKDTERIQNVYYFNDQMFYGESSIHNYIDYLHVVNICQSTSIDYLQCSMKRGWSSLSLSGYLKLLSHFKY